MSTGAYYLKVAWQKVCQAARRSSSHLHMSHTAASIDGSQVALHLLSICGNSQTPYRAAPHYCLNEIEAD